MPHLESNIEFWYLLTKYLPKIGLKLSYLIYLFISRCRGKFLKNVSTTLFWILLLESIGNMCGFLSILFESEILLNSMLIELQTHDVLYIGFSIMFEFFRCYFSTLPPYLGF